MNKWKEIEKLELDNQTYFDGIEYARQDLFRAQKVIQQNLEWIADNHKQIKELRNDEIESIGLEHIGEREVEPGIWLK